MLVNICGTRRRIPQGRLAIALLVLLTATFAGSAARAGAVICPQGAVTSQGGDWSTASTWNSNAVPDSTTKVCIMSGTVIAARGSSAADSITIMNGATLELEGFNGAAGTDDATLTASNGITNAGAIILTSGTDDAGTNFAARLIVSSGTLDNSGTLEADHGVGGDREVQASLVNTGTVTVHQTLTLDKTGGASSSSGSITIDANTAVLVIGADTTHSFTLSGGTITNGGAFVQVNGSFTHSGGSATGNQLKLEDVSLSADPASGSASLFLYDGANMLTSDVASNETLTISGEQKGGDPDGILTSAGSFTNRGIIKLTQDVAGSADLVLSSGTLHNAGTISALAGTGGVRHIRGSLVNTGTLDLQANTGFDQSGATLTQSSGTTNLDGGNLDLSGSGNPFTLSGGSLIGSGTLTGSLSNSGGRLNPGAADGARGLITVSNNYTQTSGGTLDADLHGTTTPGTDYDRLNVGGAAALGGTLAIHTDAGYSPSAGDAIQVLSSTGATSGQFATETGQFPVSGTGYRVDYSTGGVTLTALATVLFTVDKAGSGAGAVTSSPHGIRCGSACSTYFLSGGQVTLTATPDPHSRFAGWSGGGCSGTAPCQVTANSQQTITATFVKRFTLTVSKRGSGKGTVSSKPAGISCGATCAHGFDLATQVTLTAKPASTAIFTGWAGACTGQGPCTVTMSSARSAVAHFALRPVTQPGRLSHTTVTETSAGTVVLGVHNPNSLRVRGTLTLTASLSPGGAMAIGHGAATLNPRSSAALTIRLSTAARSYLKTHHTLSSHAQIVLSANGSSKTGSQALTIKARQ